MASSALSVLVVLGCLLSNNRWLTLYRTTRGDRCILRAERPPSIASALWDHTRTPRRVWVAQTTRGHATMEPHAVFDGSDLSEGEEEERRRAVVDGRSASHHAVNTSRFLRCDSWPICRRWWSLGRSTVDRLFVSMTAELSGEQIDWTDYNGIHVSRRSVFDRTPSSVGWRWWRKWRNDADSDENLTNGQRSGVYILWSTHGGQACTWSTAWSINSTRRVDDNSAPPCGYIMSVTWWSCSPWSLYVSVEFLALHYFQCGRIFMLRTVSYVEM